MKHPGRLTRHALAVAMALAVPITASADMAYDELKKTVQQLQQQLQQVQQILKKQEAKVKAFEENTVTRAEAKALEGEINAASEWKDPNLIFHMTGFADVGYVEGGNKNDSFRVGGFAPIFHAQYKDLILLEAELEFQANADGSTKVDLGYMNINWFANDYMAIGAGKFLSPIGQFRQNLHPSWINKLPSAPPGFGHDGAAPISEIGVQIRGGFPIGSMRSNYAVFVGNGPTLKMEGTAGDELDGIDAEGKGSDVDDEKVWGGRFAILPMAGLEIGVSAATGKTTPTWNETTATAIAGPQQARDYDVLGFDGVWQHRTLTLRGEYIESKVGKATTGSAASKGATWETWYTQASYLVPGSKFEGVLRYTDYDSPHKSKDQQQWTLGLNYLFASNVIGKIAYESNDGMNRKPSDDDRWLLQMAYGF